MAIDYKLFTNILGLAVFVALFALTMRRGATDPNCGMKVDRETAVKLQQGDRLAYFCSQHCADAFLAAEDPAASEDGSMPQRAR